MPKRLKLSLLAAPQKSSSGPCRSLFRGGSGVFGICWVGMIIVIFIFVVVTHEPALLLLIPPNVSSSSLQQHATATPETAASRVVVDGGAAGQTKAFPRSKRGSFLSEYRDPNHPNCKRSIVAVTTSFSDSTISNSRALPVLVSGTDGTPGCSPNGSSGGEAWTVEGIIDEFSGIILVDFSSKGGPTDLMGQKIPEGILWEGKNTWIHSRRTE